LQAAERPDVDSANARVSLIEQIKRCASRRPLQRKGELMKLVTDRDGRAGVVVDDRVVALADLDGVPADLTAVLAAGPDVAALVARKAAAAAAATPLAEVELGAPIPRPSKYLAIGFNYKSHLAEIQEAGTKPQYAEAMARFSHMRQAFPDQKLPTFFNKQVSSITGPYDPILAPYDSTMLDFEGELVAVIGRRLRRADPATALAAVAGYTVGNDVSVRDWQQDTPTMWPGKSFDTHGPIGPWVITADEIDPADLAIRTWVDDELRQDGSTADMVTGIAEMISALSKVCSLEPGDLVATGTPGGVGLFTGRMLTPGQHVRVEIEGIGAIDNPIVAETPPTSDA
jgi:2-keto-4-pentenoate hydratase/2-oxohepta-3-ene-1,7-dioic acid hydratase in catechol pathway